MAALSEAEHLGTTPADFVARNTEVQVPPLVPELRLRLASELFPLWRMTEQELAATGLPPPYWAFAWAGGQALARYLLDNPDVVAGRSVLDMGSGGGLVAMAAARAGAARVLAADIDPYAIAAMTLNLAFNDLAVEMVCEDLIDSDGGWQVVLVGDLFYEQPLAERLESWLRRLAARGALVLVGDPKRTYLPRTGLDRLARYAVPTSRELEDSDLRNACVWRLTPD
ncbi:MAG: 50S ribosomal protein L11 methyltransferase [Alphaproteobacteria bacterium]|jgi:predicted nicotinamide N-methyase|nr:50S ribosomal protein L11 methyltransferase [Alphaproteobacteria bacterium]MDP6831144.1 50S ribosomal protein L11 methyltransferase [Alphaproteobacteria bacterium]